ncbi:MAG TPA: hypothetical protein VFI34_11405 [Candidatus Limnocylindrales bacterium]|nr:hypothetical protein [Candidatus Limnocylindrales bacterium]
MAPGIQDFTYLNVGHETVKGTPVAPTRQMYVDGTGVLEPDPHLNFHQGENRGRRSTIARVTQMGEDVGLKVRHGEGVSFDDLIVYHSFLNGTAAAVGAGADKTWTQTPSMTASNSPQSYSADVGDDVQNWRIQYGMVSRFKLAASLISVTTLEADWFGQRAVKGAKANPASNLSPKIPGDLWTLKFAGTFAGLAGAAVQNAFLVGWELEVMTGLVWRHYMDGNLYGAQHVETAISGTLKLTVESTALAISEAYDKWMSQTADYVRLKATGPTLGGSAYSAQYDLPILWSNVPPITKADQGVNLYELEANLFDDGTNAPINPVTVGSLTALP